MKIIFLDIDGVLNIYSGSNTTYMKYGYHIEKEMVENLNKLLNNIDYNIVISSSWKDDMKDLKLQLENNNFLFWDRVIGITPLNIFNFRGEEINNFLENNKDIVDYIVFDDNVSEICGEMCDVIPKEKVIEFDSSLGYDKKMIKLINNKLNIN